MLHKNSEGENVEFCSDKTMRVYKNTLIIYPFICLVYFSENALAFLGEFGVEQHFLKWNGFVSGFDGDYRNVVLFSWLYLVSFFHGFITVFFDLKGNLNYHYRIKPWAFWIFSIMSIGLMVLYPFHGDSHVTRVVTYGGYFSLALNGWLFSVMAIILFFAPVCGFFHMFMSDEKGVSGIIKEKGE